MMAGARLSCTWTPRVRYWGVTSQIRYWLSLLIIALLLDFMGFTALRHTTAETTSPPRLIPLEHVPGFPKRGSVTTMANLRSAPSMQSEVVSIIKDGMSVEILTETGRWYRVKTEEGLEAWIGKSLVAVEPTPQKMPSPFRGTPAPPEMQAREESPSPAPVTDDTPAETATPHSEDTADQQDAGPPLELPEEGLPISLEEDAFHWPIDGMFPYVQSLEAYVIPALVIVLILAIFFQLKAARQLRRAMQEMGLILDLVDDIYANRMLARTGDGEATAKALSQSASVSRLETPSIQFSALEYAMLQAMSDDREVDEKELTEALAAKGFTGVLTKAVIGGIIRKTKASGQQRIDVRYVQGRYRYQLRRESTSVPRTN
jgi:hypothetical protein